MRRGCARVQIIHVEAESNQTLSVLPGKIVVRGKLITMMPQGPQNDPEFSPPNLPPPSWREDFVGTDPELVRCLIVAASLSYVYALGLVALDDGWRAHPSIFGWDKDRRKWENEEELKIITSL